MLFNDTDRAAIATAIADAEASTAGEIVVVVTTEPYRYAATALSAAALAALAIPFLALLLGWLPGSLVFGWDAAMAPVSERSGLQVFVVVQVAVFAAVLALFWFTPLARLCTPHGLRRDRVHRAAVTQFKARGIERTEGRTGVLIYIDEPDHIAEVVADSAIYAKVSPDHWTATVTVLLAGIKAGRPGQGVVDAVALAGAVLAEHFPPLPGDVNELPDHLIEL